MKWQSRSLSSRSLQRSVPRPTRHPERQRRFLRPSAAQLHSWSRPLLSTEHRPSAPERPELLVSILGGVVAAAAAGAGMAFLRSTLQIRSVPERVIEWVLLFVPIDAFAGGIQRFGFDAKRYALWAAIVAMMSVLAIIGAFALHRSWTTGRILGLGIVLWLFVMVVIMPLTDAGLFAIALID